MEYNPFNELFNRVLEGNYTQREMVIPMLRELLDAKQTPIQTRKGLPTMRQKGGRLAGGAGKKSELSVKVGYKFSEKTVNHLNRLAEEYQGLDKSAFVHNLVAQWFEEHGY